jgi:hypothetical protein
MKIQSIGRPGNNLADNYGNYNAGIYGADQYDQREVVPNQGFNYGMGKGGARWDNIKRKVGDIVDKAKDKVKDAVDTGKNAGAKIGFAAGRAAFLALTLLNAKWLATKMDKMIAAGKEGELQKFWAFFGGEYKHLVEAINKGKNKKGIGAGSFEAGIGEPTTIAASLIAAAPLILAIIKELHKNKLADGDDLKTLETLKDGADNNVNGNVMPNPEDKPGDTPKPAAGGVMDKLAAIPTPVKLLGGAALAFGAYQVFKPKTKKRK